MRAVVLADVYCWTTRVEGTVPAQFDHHRAFRRSVIEISDEEFTRGFDLGGLAQEAVAAEALAADDAANGHPLPAGADGDAALNEMSAAELVAYVTQFPGERERVYLLERARAETQQRAPFVTVLRATGHDPASGEGDTPSA